MADKEFTQICKEILGIGKRLEKIDPEELREIKASIERLSEAFNASKESFDESKSDFDGKYNKVAQIVATFDVLKAQIEEVLKSGTINDSTEALISTFSSKKIMNLLNEVKGAVDEKFSIIHKNGITPWSSSLEYPAGAISVLNDKLYQAKTQNINKKPSENKEEWRVLASEEWCEQTFLNKDEKIDAYTKVESDERYAQKSDITDGVKIGSYLLWSSQSVTPAGFLLCDGRSLKKSEYKELFNIIGYTYGGSGDSFNLPKFNDGRFFRSIGGNAAELGVAQKGTLVVGEHDSNANYGFELRNTEPIKKNFQDNIGADKLTSEYLQGNYKALAVANGNSHSVAMNHTEATSIYGIARPYNSSMVVLIKAKDVKEPNKNEVDKSIYATETKAGIIKIKNSITGQQEDVAVSEKAVSKALKAQLPLGVEQTWQDKKNERRGGIVYTNTSLRPILASVTLVGTSETASQIIIDNINISSVTTANQRSIATFIVPANSTYKVGDSATQIGLWFELR